MKHLKNYGCLLVMCALFLGGCEPEAACDPESHPQWCAGEEGSAPSFSILQLAEDLVYEAGEHDVFIMALRVEGGEFEDHEIQELIFLLDGAATPAELEHPELHMTHGPQIAEGEWDEEQGLLRFPINDLIVEAQGTRNLEVRFTLNDDIFHDEFHLCSTDLMFRGVESQTQGIVSPNDGERCSQRIRVVPQITSRANFFERRNPHPREENGYTNLGLTFVLDGLWSHFDDMIPSIEFTIEQEPDEGRPRMQTLLLRRTLDLGRPYGSCNALNRQCIMSWAGEEPREGDFDNPSIVRNGIEDFEFWANLGGFTGDLRICAHRMHVQSFRFRYEYEVEFNNAPFCYTHRVRAQDQAQ